MLKYLGHRQDHFVLKEKIEQYIKELPENEEKINLKDLEKELKTVEHDLLAKAKNKWKELIDHADIKKRPYQPLFVPRNGVEPLRPLRPTGF